MNKPWIDGTRELLEHAANHIIDKSDFDKRIAFISIDNAVELAIKTYLGLPKRVRLNAGPSRKELQDAENSFPTYLELLEKYDSNKLVGISLEDIEWYHRLRNQLYHSGNGITVELSKVETYFEISKALYENLFGEKFTNPARLSIVTDMGHFIDKWIKLESNLRKKLPPKDGSHVFYWKRDFIGTIDPKLVEIYNEVSLFRNNVIHGLVKPSNEEFKQMTAKVEFLYDRI